MTHALMDIADALGVRVKHVALNRRDGEYLHGKKLIRLQEGMTIRHERSILAHEIAHAVFADVPSKFGPVNAKQERRADEWAALRLITPDEYRVAEERWDGHVGAMAYDLGVIARLVKAYQRVLLRVGETVYVTPRMGIGQWSEKVEAHG